MVLLKMGYVGPANYDFMGTRAISVYKDTDIPTSIPIDAMDVGGANLEKNDEEANVSVTPIDQLDSSDADTVGTYVISRKVLESTFKRATSYSLMLAFTVTVIGKSISNVTHFCYRHVRAFEPGSSSQQFHYQFFSLITCLAKISSRFGLLVQCE
jgi:hypothetical protein